MLLHGWALDRRIWQPQLEALDERLMLIAVDRRGFGRTTARPDLAREPDDVIRLLDCLGIDRVALVGMSQGARIALHFAIAHPDRVAALVLDGAPLDGFRPEARGEDAIPLGEYSQLVSDGRIDEVKRRWQSHPLMQGVPQGQQSLLGKVLDDYQARDLVAGSAHNLDPITDRLAMIDAPALIMTGEFDTNWRQSVGDALAQDLPKARRVVISGGHHLCNLSHPAEYNRLLAEFVAANRA